MNVAATPEQIDFLLTFLEKYTPLARGIMRGQNRVMGKKLWVKLTRKLNALGGAKKSIQQWQKVWADKKYLVKKAVFASKVSPADGGPSLGSVHFTETELRIFNLIGKRSWEPDTPMALPTIPIVTEEDGCRKKEGPLGSIVTEKVFMKPAQDRLNTEEDSFRTDEDSLESDSGYLETNRADAVSPENKMNDAPTPEQIDFLLTFLEKYTPLARGIMRGRQNRVNGKKLWMELTRKLNALGGAKKSIQQWQKVWATKKYFVKKAVFASKVSLADGGPSVGSFRFTETELRIFNLIGKSSWEPDTPMAFPTTPIVTEEDGCRTKEGSLESIFTEEVFMKPAEDRVKTFQFQITDEDSLESDSDSLETNKADAVSPENKTYTYTAAPEQIDFMLTFFEKHTSLARGSLRSAQNRVKNKKLWVELTRKLNALGGAKKSIQQWQKVWADRKYLVKKAAFASKVSPADGGPSLGSVGFTETELRIFNLIVKSGVPDTPMALSTTPIVTEEDGCRTKEGSLGSIVTEQVFIKPAEDRFKTEEDSFRIDEDSMESDSDSLESDSDVLETNKADAVSPENKMYTYTAAPEQIDFMLTFFEKHTSLARGSLRSAHNRVKNKKLWVELTRKLNALGGAKKSIQQWQKVWTDKKYLVKKAAFASKVSPADGGPSLGSVGFTETELRIFNLIVKSGVPDTPMALSTTPIVTEEDGCRTKEGSLGSIVTEQVFIKPAEDRFKTEEDSFRIDEDSMESDSDSLESDSDVLETNKADAVSPAPGPERSQRQRQPSPESSFRSRLFRMEEARLAAEELQAQELGGIRRSLETLVNLLQTYLNGQ